MAKSTVANPKSNPGYTPVPASTGNAAMAAIPPAASNSSKTVGVGKQLLPAALTGLTLMNGMTAGYGDMDGHTSNPPAAKGSYGGNPKWAPKRIGLMRNSTASGLSQQYSLYFIFNPNQIQVGFTTTPGSNPANYYAADSAVPGMANAQSVSWSLIFDRTYDLLYGDNHNGDGGNSRGVLEDTAALYNIMGSYESGGGTPMSTLVEVAFAQEKSGQLWGFTGYITSVNITYGIFRYDMIPSHCEVDLTMTTTYIGNIPTSKLGGKTQVLSTNTPSPVVNGKLKSSIPVGVAKSSQPTVAKSQAPGTKTGGGNTKGPPTTGGV